MSDFYHQDERDYAMGCGCLIVMVPLVLFAITAIVAVVLAAVS
jgi:hypothetical protein